MATPITITATKYDGSLLRRWTGELRERRNDLVIAVVWAGTRAEGAQGNWNVAWHTTAYFVPGRWYNVFRYDDPYRGLMGYHCHIATPPDIDPDHVGFADLGMSLWAPRRGDPEVRERDLYEAEAQRLAYPPEVRAAAEAAFDTLRAMVAKREFPFEPE